MTQTLSPTARVWLYQAGRPLTGAEVAVLRARLTDFVGRWAAHGQALCAAAEVRRGQFVVLAVDESAAGASGCSIDSSVQVLRELEQELGVSLLDKSRMAFEVAGAVQLLTRAELRAAVAAGTITANTLYFNNTLATLGELAAHWPAPAGQTWLASYFVPRPADSR